MMRRLGLFVCAVLCLAVMFGGCAKDDENGLLPTEFDKKGTLYGCIFDAITGAAIKGDDTIKVYLVQGDNIRTPTKLITSATDDNAGEYAFTDIPVDLYSGNKTYKIKVVKSGYQTFVGIVGFTAFSSGTPNGETTRIDNSYIKLGNIYLFPVGATAGDINIKVTTPSGELVNGATVRLQPNIGGNTAYAELSAAGNRIAAVPGYMPSFSATTDSTGTATFNDSTLVLGGQYTPIVEPITFNNQQLAGITGAAIILGTNNVNQTIAMTAVVTEPNPLYVDIASNSTPGTVDSAGVLVLTFNQALRLTIGFESTFVGTLSGSSGAVFDTAATSNVTAALSNSDKTLTITPHFSTYATAGGATITYTFNGIIYANNTQLAAITDTDADGDCLDQVRDKYNVVISRMVQLKAR